MRIRMRIKMGMNLNDLIEDFKKRVNDLDENTNVEDFDKNLVDIRIILNKINVENYHRKVGYFIAINDIGPDDDFTRYYTPIGLMTEAEAFYILNTISSEYGYYSSGHDDHVEQVSEETYEEWYALAIYSTMLEYSEWMDAEHRLTNDELRPIKDKVLQLRKHLGLSRRWEEVCLYRK